MRPILFVYGTLRQGGRYHAEYFPERPIVRPARMPGRIYHLPAGYPAVACDGSGLLAQATGDDDVDRVRELTWRANLSHVPKGEPPAGAEWVHGELITLPDRRRLRVLDELEGFRPGAPSLFLRILVPVWLADATVTVPAWAYVQPDPQGIHLPEGRWKE